MKTRKIIDYIMSGIGFALIISWIVNLVKLIMCDFADPWRDEIIHALVLFPIVSLVTCWF